MTVAALPGGMTLVYINKVSRKFQGKLESFPIQLASTRINASMCCTLRGPDTGRFMRTKLANRHFGFPLMDACIINPENSTMTSKPSNRGGLARGSACSARSPKHGISLTSYSYL